MKASNRLFVGVLALLISFNSLYATKVKELANIVGVRENQLIGYGLVVGLNGTGDGTTSVFTTQSLANLLANVNVKIPASAIKSKNIAAVIVTAKLPAFSRQGDKLDVSVSSIGDSKSIEGGTLLLTPLKSVDGKIYALAQGPIAIGGVNAGGGGGGKAQKHQTTGASIFGGAIVEKEVPFELSSLDTATLSLKKSNFQNVVKIQEVINASFGGMTANAIDPGTIKLTKPKATSMVEFLAKIENLMVDPDRDMTKIVIDERTGTVIAGADIRIAPIVITHGEITIKIRPKRDNEVAMAGDTPIGDEVSVGLQSNIVTAGDGAMTVSSIARSLQKLGQKPKDIIAVLEAMKKAGAYDADLEII